MRAASTLLRNTCKISHDVPSQHYVTTLSVIVCQILKNLLLYYKPCYKCVAKVRSIDFNENIDLFYS